MVADKEDLTLLPVEIDKKLEDLDQEGIKKIWWREIIKTFIKNEK